MCGWRAFSCPFLGHDVQTEAFSCAVPISTTRSLPSRAAASQIRTSDLLFVLSFLEVHDRNLMSLGEPVDRFYLFITDPAKRG